MKKFDIARFVRYWLDKGVSQRMVAQWVYSEARTSVGFMSREDAASFVRVLVACDELADRSEDVKFGGVTIEEEF